MHWFYTQKKPKKMRKQMLLSETLADQTVLRHQPASCPACHGQLLWVTAQNLKRAPCLFCSPTAAVGFPVLHWSQHRSYGPAALTTITLAYHYKYYSWLLGIALGSLPLKAKLIKITINTYVQLTGPNFDLWFVYSPNCLLETGPLLERALFL